jgi:hypothetical protein
MEERKEWFSLEETAEILRPERDGQLLPKHEAVKWLLDTMLNFLEQEAESLLLPSYVFNELVEVWDIRNGKKSEPEKFSGMIDIWIEGKSPRNGSSLMPGLLDLTPYLRSDSRKHGDYHVSLHYTVPEKPQEYPQIRLVESKAVRESELVVSRDKLERYASELGLDDVLEQIDLRDYKKQEEEDETRDTKEKRLQWQEKRLKACITMVDELRKKPKMTDMEIACHLYDHKGMPWGVIGKAIRRDGVSRSPSGWHKEGIRTAGRETAQLKKSTVNR